MPLPEGQGLIFHHVGIASDSIAQEEEIFSKLGYVRDGVVFTDPAQKITGLFMVLGNFRIELLEPTSPDSPVVGFVRRGMKMYHQAFFCGDLPGTLRTLSDQGAFVVVPPVPAVAFNGRKISFLVLRNKVMIELIEAPSRV